MGWKRAKRDERAQKIYDEFQALPEIPVRALKSPYITLAVATTKNANPNVPMTGYAVYEGEIIHMSAKSFQFYPLREKGRFGEGELPQVPFRIAFKKMGRYKIIDERRHR